MRIAHEANILDLTNFDGDVDMALPGEAYFSRRLKKEGKLRRLQSRNLPAMEKMNEDSRLSHPLTYSEVRTPRHVRDPRQAYFDQHAAPSQSSRVPRPQKILTLPTQSTDRLLPISPLSEQSTSASSETDFYSPSSYRSELPLHASNSMRLSPDLPPTVSLVTVGGARSAGYPVKSYHDVESELGRPHAVQMPPSTTSVHLYDSHSAAHSTLTLGASDCIPFEMGEQEAIDANVVSEHARPGKPKLDKVIADEVQASKGAIVVACQSTLFSSGCLHEADGLPFVLGCGPTSLNAMVRKIVAAQIDPGRIRRGDMRGSITLVSEEFDY